MASNHARDGVTRGLIVGTFMPPHAGHVLLGETARALVDELTIVVTFRHDDPISGALRVAWMQELVPRARVVDYHASLPRLPWKEIARAAHPEPIDIVFGSDEADARLAAELGARFRPIDPDRLAVPVSARAIRADPWAHWWALPAPVRPYYARTVCLHGPESVGKSTLARALASHFATLHVPEYGRIWCEAFGNDCAMEDLLAIARTHDAMTRSLLRQCDRRLFLDTDPLMTAVWADMMLGRRDPWLDAWEGTADLYLLLDIDAPWIDDGTRIYGDDDSRRRFLDLSRAELERRGVEWITISGPLDTRLPQAIAAVEAMSAP